MNTQLKTLSIQLLKTEISNYSRSKVPGNSNIWSLFNPSVLVYKGINVTHHVYCTKQKEFFVPICIQSYNDNWFQAYHNDYLLVGNEFGGYSVKNSVVNRGCTHTPLFRSNNIYDCIDFLLNTTPYNG